MYVSRFAGTRRKAWSSKRDSVFCPPINQGISWVFYTQIDIAHTALKLLTWLIISFTTFVKFMILPTFPKCYY